VRWFKVTRVPEMPGEAEISRREPGPAA
jgi:hypothetical protein